MTNSLTAIEATLAYEKLQKEKSDYDKSIQDAIGKENNFEARRDWLRQKWKTKKDSAALRLISGVVLNKIPTPISVSIIADNLSYFKEHSGDYNVDDFEVALGRSCLCGSKKVAEFILEKLKSDYIAETHWYLLGYVSASQNEAWSEEIAIKMAKAKIAIPTSIYSLSHSYEVIDKIVQIFREASLDKVNVIIPTPSDVGRAVDMTPRKHSEHVLVSVKKNDESELLKQRLKLIMLLASQELTLHSASSPKIVLNPSDSPKKQEVTPARNFSKELEFIEEIYKKQLAEQENKLMQAYESRELLMEKLATQEKIMSSLRKELEDVYQKVNTMQSAEKMPNKSASYTVTDS